MFRLRIFILLGWFVTAPSLSADLPTAVEPDKRLQSEGKGWRLEKAQVINSERPRILLIGDSILNGYARQVIKKLNGRAYIDLWVNPYHQSKNLNEVLERVLSQGPYDLVHFKSYIDKKPTYHTNVLMFITDKFAGICFDSISDSKYLLLNIEKTHKILNLSIEQVKNFSGNAIVVRNITNEAKFLISSSGLKALDLIQIKFIEKYYDIVEINIPTIERIGGGSVRCMLLELF